MDPQLHPFEKAREYTRALNATKLDKVQMKLFSLETRIIHSKELDIIIIMILEEILRILIIIVIIGIGVCKTAGICFRRA